MPKQWLLTAHELSVCLDRVWIGTDGWSDTTAEGDQLRRMQAMRPASSPGPFYLGLVPYRNKNAMSTNYVERWQKMQVDRLKNQRSTKQSTSWTTALVSAADDDTFNYDNISVWESNRTFLMPNGNMKTAAFSNVLVSKVRITMNGIVTVFELEPAFRGRHTLQELVTWPDEKRASAPRVGDWSDSARNFWGVLPDYTTEVQHAHTWSPVVRAAIGRWDFAQNGLKDLGGKVGDVVIQNSKAKLTSDGLKLVAGSLVSSAPNKGKTEVSVGQAKTIAAWVTLANTGVRSGAVISIESSQPHQFDAIVWAERQTGYWMAGSDNFKRTRDVSGSGKVKETANTQVLMAVVYTENSVQIYRNGVKYGNSYSTGSSTYPKGKWWILFGPRCCGSAGGVDGTVHHAMYWDKALSPAEVVEVYKAGATGSVYASYDTSIVRRSRSPVLPLRPVLARPQAWNHTTGSTAKAGARRDWRRSNVGSTVLERVPKRPRPLGSVPHERPSDATKKFYEQQVETKRVTELQNYVPPPPPPPLPPRLTWQG